ncbi:8849_t:CDS:1 [Gigaspora margarita]|uniref:8849_t:CDS:1 n=1 Tax=Gigaspora margarita TaxID=4874 RepID=A0ABM8W5U3_GIGMA|nr:8849_t:CDS:1 [Gigaspora margarita]
MNSKIIQHFTSHKEFTEKLINNKLNSNLLFKTITSNYLTERYKYKTTTFNQDGSGFINSSQNEILRSFDGLVNTLKKSEYDKFIKITSLQDVKVFDEFMVNILQKSQSNFNDDVNQFIEVQNSNFQESSNKSLIELPSVVQEYFTTIHLEYKTDLYLNSKFVDERFDQVNLRCKKIISSLDSDEKIQFAKASMFQDYILNCKMHNLAMGVK